MRKITRTTAARKIVDSKGRFIGITYQGSKDKVKIVNAQFTVSSEQFQEVDKLHGRFTIYDRNRKKYKRIFTASLIGIRSNKVKYIIK